MAQANVRPGPSQRRKARPGLKRLKTSVNSSKSRKVSESQRLTALEQSASQFVPPDDLQTFADLPISELTKRGLKKSFFVNMTDIQSQSLPVSLKCKDVLGAARTGSGKTLAFLIPVLEILYRRKWGPQDGLGALIISPTRELALQIFDVLRSIGGYHSFSAGLVIGGKNLKDEKERLSRMNILVATPGRLLQHMDQTIGFECDNLQLLVLDEADRILDMGFSRTLTALLTHLPKSRQTLLFSATQTQSVTDLARLSLHDPVYIGVQEKDYEGSTPKNLEQHYVICELDKKLDVLWSFIKSHLQCKVLVFMSSCKQVRFVFETFCKLHPGIPLLHLHGKQKQTMRITTYSRFNSSKLAVLFATDIAARGLDFPSVDWVLQVDAPEDGDTYIHRVGRTARYESAGKGLLFVLPSEEEGVLKALKKKNIEIAKIKIKASKTQSIENQLQNLAFQDPEVKYLGQRAFVSYLRSVYLQKDKSIFKVDELPVDRFAASLGLPGAPKIKFLSKELAKKQKNASRAVASAQGEYDSGAESSRHSSSEEDETEVAGPSNITEAADNSKPAGVRTKYDRMFGRKNQNILSEHYSKLVDHSEGASNDDDDDFITLKRADHDLESDLPNHNDVSKRKEKVGQSKRAMLKYKGVGQKLHFDEEGKPHEVYEMADPEEFFKAGDQEVKEAGRKFVEGERGRLMEADILDKAEAKDKKKEKKRKRKEKESGLREDLGAPILAPLDDDDGYQSPEFDLPSDSDDNSDVSPPPAKRGRKLQTRSPEHTLEDEEELALQMLRQKR